MYYHSRCADPTYSPNFSRLAGISRSSRHKRSATGAQRAHYRKKRKFELGRQAANTKLGAKRIHTVRVRGGNAKYRALRLESGNFAWGSEHLTRKTRIIGVVRISVHQDMLVAIQIMFVWKGVQCL
jgi:small subunit ribosomal protein S8e